MAPTVTVDVNDPEAAGAQRAIGRIEGRLSGFETRLGKIEDGMKTQDDKLDLLVQRSAVVRNQRKLIAGVGAFAVGFTAILGELVNWYRGH